MLNLAMTKIVSNQYLLQKKKITKIVGNFAKKKNISLTKQPQLDKSIMVVRKKKLKIGKMYFKDLYFFAIFVVDLQLLFI